MIAALEGENLKPDRTGDGLVEGKLTKPGLINRLLRRKRRERRTEAAEVRSILREVGWGPRGRRK